MRYLGKIAFLCSLRDDLKHVYVSSFTSYSCHINVISLENIHIVFVNQLFALSFGP